MMVAPDATVQPVRTTVPLPPPKVVDAATLTALPTLIVPAPVIEPDRAMLEAVHNTHAMQCNTKHTHKTNIQNTE